MTAAIASRCRCQKGQTLPMLHFPGTRLGRDEIATLSTNPGSKQGLSPLCRFLMFCCLVTAGCGSGESEVSWQAVELGTDAEFRDIFFLDARQGWMVGGVGVSVPGGIVARTRDGGLTWQYQTKVITERHGSTSVDLNAVHFTDELHGVVAAESGTILRTVDGGATWDRIFPTGSIYAHHRDVEFVDEANGWIIGRQGVLRTEDGGVTWWRIDEDLGAAGEDLQMLDASRGWMVGKFGRVHRTADGGVTWEQVPALGDLEGLSGDEKPHLRSVHFVDADHGWIAGSWRDMPNFEQHDRAVILHTGDGGRTWQRQIVGVESLLTAIRFADRERGWAVGFNRNDGSSAILATIDGGRSWATQRTVHGEELLDIEVRDGHVWTAGDRVRKEPQRLFWIVAVADSSMEGVDDGE
jgi:photosystem II stability/assembly factor-like uncharacterized protein